MHTEDFAQVFGVYPEKKYEKATLRNILAVLAAETSDGDIEEFIRRLVFSALIGNGDMHLKNWSLIYPDGRNAAIAPAYDLLSTIPYIPNDRMALKVSRTREFTGLNRDELEHLAAKAGVPVKLVLETAAETVDLFHQHWATEKDHLPMADNVRASIDAHFHRLPLFQ